jgi:cobalt-zinc-cadmium efflux system outer membrane protein
MNADSLGVPAPTPDAESSAHVALIASGTLPDPARLDIDSLVELALTRRPDLAATTATVREFETLASLARREALPNLRRGAVAERVPGESGFRIGPAFGISVPIWNRNQGVVDERLAQVRQAQLQRQAVELRVRTDVETAVRSYRAATQEAATFETTVRQPARTNSALLETAFRAGKIALPTLLLLRNQLLDAELGYWDAWLARQDALVQLQAATGLLASDALSAADTSLPTSSTKP